MSQTTPDGQSGQWQQPPFTPGGEPAEVPVVSGQVVVPGAPPSAPGVAESMLNVVIGVIWPIAIVLGIFGIGAFMANIFMAILASIVLGQIAKELKRRRRMRELGGRTPELR